MKKWRCLRTEKIPASLLILLQLYELLRDTNYESGGRQKLLGHWSVQRIYVRESENPGGRKLACEA